MHGVSNEFGSVFVKEFRSHMKAEVDPEEKVNLKPVHFTNQHSPDLRVISVVVVCVIKKLCRK